MTKQKKEPSAKQLAARKAASEQLKRMHAEKIANKVNELNGSPAPEPRPAPGTTDTEDTTDFQEPEQDYQELKRQLAETNETMALLKAALLGSNNAGAGGQPAQNIGVGNQGRLIGEVEKYLVDPDNYPDPTPRLAKENRLQAVNFNFNYELDYRMDIVAYETKTGVNMKEPKFHITLNRIVVDDQGNQTDKRYIAKRLVFHEDPQAAIVIARENGLPIDQTNEKAFLDEMRYLRCRDWLFGVFWPKAADEKPQIKEEVIGGTIVQVFTRASEDPSDVEFDKLKTKF